jgi:phage terminase small subunit
MRSLILPELISESKVNNEDDEKTSPYCTKYELLPSFINKTSAA